MANSFLTDNSVSIQPAPESLTDTLEDKGINPQDANPIAKQYLGVPLTPEEKQYIQDFTYESPFAFDALYGRGAYAQALTNEREGSAYARDKLAAQNTSFFNLKDTGKDVASGLASSFFSTGAFVAENTGAIDGASDIVKLSENISKNIAATTSYEHRAASRANEYANRIRKLISDAEFAKNLKYINSLPPEEQEAALSAAITAREARGFVDSFASSLETNQYKEAMSSGLGSTLGSAIGAKGLGKLGSAVKTAVPASTVAKASKLYASAHPQVQKTLQAVPWMAMESAQAAGDVLAQNLSSEETKAIMQEIPLSKLMESQYFRDRYTKHINELGDVKQAEYLARKDVLHARARDAANTQFLYSAPLNRFTSSLAKPFSLNGNKLSTYIGEGLINIPEEGIEGATGQYFSNVAKQKYVDPKQDIYEDIGSSAAEEAIGGMGISAIRGPGALIGAMSDQVQERRAKTEQSAPKVLTEKVETTPETVTLSSDKAKDSSGGNVTNEITTDTGETYLVSENALIQNQASNTSLEEANQNSSASTESENQPSSSSWDQAYFVSSDSTISEDLNSEGAKEKLDSFSEKKIDSDGSIQVKESTSSEWRPLKRSDLNKNITSGSEADTNIVLPKTSSPIKGSNIVKVSVDPNGNIKNLGITGSINSTKDVRILKPVTPKSQAVQAKPDVINVAPINETFESTVFPDSPFEFRNDNSSIIYRDPNTKVAYPMFTPEETQDLLSTGKTPEEVNKALQERYAASLKPAEPFIINQNNNEQVIAVSNGQVFLNNRAYDLSKETALVFDNPNATAQEKAKALEAEFDGDDFIIIPASTTSRDAYDLTPSERAKQGLYIEDGQVKEYDKAEVKESWANKFKEKFKKLKDFFIPVRRPVHLWNSDKTPIEVLQGLLTDKSTLENYLRANNFTNASSIANALWGNKEKLVKEVTQMLAKNGIFMSKFREQVNAGYFKMDKDCPEALKETFYDAEGNPNDKLLEIASIAALHWVALCSAYKHQLTDVEFTRLLIDPDTLVSQFDTTGGVVTSAALQNLATSIRKFSGVAINNEVDTKEAEKVFGYLAVKVAGALIEANVIETFEVDYSVEDFNENTGVTEIKERKLQFIRPTSDFNKLFRPKSGILLSIIDPTYANSFHLEPPAIKETIAHSSERITATQKRVLKIVNNKPASFNKLFVQFLVAIGGEEGLADLLEENANADFRGLHSLKDYQSKQGKAISRRLAFDLIREVLVSNPNMTIEEFKIYFSNVVLKNSRIMQEGAATYQSNKLVRQILNYTDGKKHDLTKEDNLRGWKTVLAQNLGIKINSKLFKNYEASIDAALTWIQDQVSSSEFKDLLKDIKNIDPRSLLQLDDKSKDSEKVREVRKAFKKLFKDFNQQFKGKLSLKKEEGFNALLEMLRYAEATSNKENKSEDLKSFESHIFVEVDGINDGPSYINRVFGAAMGSFSTQFFINNAKTGIFFGIDVTSQQAMDDPEISKFLFGTEEGKDFHKEVANEKITNYFLQRLIAFKRVKENAVTDQGVPSPKVKEAERAIEVIRNTLVFFKAIGWIDTKGKSIDSIIENTNSIDPDPNNYPFTFDREISKKLVTIIPYGSQPKGSTEQVLQLGLETFYENMTKCFMVVVSKPEYLSNYKVIDKFQKAMTSGEEIVVIDTETTSDVNGPDVDKDVALQISVKKIRNGQVVATKTYFVENKSGRQLQKTFKNNKDNPLFDIYNDEKIIKQSTEEVWKDLKGFIGNATLLGHNIEAFDIPILERQFGTKITNNSVDTLLVSRAIQPRVSSHSLSSLIDINGTAHLADADVDATQKLAEELLTKSDEVKERIVTHFEESKQKDTTMNGVPFSSVMGALKNLFGYKYSQIAYSSAGVFEDNSENIDEYTFSFDTALPTEEELNETWTVPAGSGLLVNNTNKDKKTVRNFYIKTNGIKHLRDLIAPIFGEPAQAAVNEVLTPKGMLGGLFPTVVSGLLTFVKLSLQSIYQRDNEKARAENKAVTNTDLYKQQHEMNSVGPTYNLPGGAKVVVEKTGYATDSEVLYKDSKSGLEYRSSESFVTSSGVSGGALTTQGIGDATSMMELEEILNELSIVVGSVHDGFYTLFHLMDKVKKSANKAADLAQRQKVLSAIKKQIERSGKKIKKLGYSNKDNPIEAIKDCLVKIAQGKLIDGTTVDKDVVKRAKEAQYELLRYLDQLKETFEFESNFFAQRENKLHAPKKGVKEDEANIERAVRERLNEFFNKFDAVVLTEEVNQEVLSSIPRTNVHMSGPESEDSSYKVGNVPGKDKAKELLKLANKCMKDLTLPTFNSFYDLLTAYINEKCYRLYKHKLSKRDISDSIRKEFEILNGFDKGNSGTVNQLPEDVFNILNTQYGGVNAVTKQPSTNKSDFNLVTLGKNSVNIAFKALAKKVKHPGIYEKFAKAVLSLIPENIPIYIASSKAALPANVRARFNNSKQQGIYIVENGKPAIYIISNKRKFNPWDLEIAQLIAHESIHAVISATIAIFKQNPKKVPSAQRTALYNLEKLLDTFMKESPDIQSSVVWNLRDRLAKSKSMAEKLDESIAYVMSNVEIFNAISNHKFKDLTPHKNNFHNLLKSILGTIYDFIISFFGIKQNSSLDNYLSKFFKGLDSSIPEELNFLSLYGANTLVVLGEDIRDPEGRKTRKEESGVQELIRSAFTLSSDKYIKDVSFSLENLRDNPVEFVKEASNLFIRASAWFKALSKNTPSNNLDNVRKKISDKESIREVKKLSDYSERLIDFFRGLVPDDKVDSLANTVIMLQTRGFIPSMTLKSLNDIYVETKNNLIPALEAFISDTVNNSVEQIELVKKLLDFLQNKNIHIKDKSIIPQVINPHFQNAAIFYALANHVPEFAEIIGKVKIPQSVAPSLKESTNPFTVKTAMEKLSEAIMNHWSELKFGETAAGEIVHIIDNGKGEPGHPTLTKVAQSINSVFHTLDRSLTYVLLAPWLLFGNNTADSFKEALKDALDRPIVSYGLLTNKFREFANKHCSVFMSGMIKELYGRTPSNTSVEVLLKQIKGFFDKDRKINLDFLTKKLISEFKNTKVDTKLKSFLYRVLGTSEIIHLSNDEIKEVLTDKNKLESLIKSLEGELKDNSEHSSKYMAKALQLAKYLAGKEDAGVNLLTNGHAIALLFGEPEAQDLITLPISKDIFRINRLITCYYLRESLSTNDISKLKDIYSKDESAMNAVINQLKTTYDRELARTTERYGNSLSNPYIYNRMHGFLPKGSQARGHYAIVPKAEAENYWRKGYEILGDYPASSGDRSVPMVRVYTQWPHEREAQEGIFQTITQTASGWEVERGTRAEATGTKILELKAVEYLDRNFRAKNIKNIIPIYSDSGKLIGYERAIPKEDRAKINENVDIFSGIAQWNVRQTREDESANINDKAVDLLYADWENATEEQRKTEFEDIFNSKNLAIKAAVQRLPESLKRELRQRFGGNVCYVRKDVVWSYIGYHRMSITDIWDNTSIFPKSFENALAKILDIIFFNGRGRFYAGNIETVLMGAVTWVRDTIIVRSGFVPLLNAIANVFTLHFSLGIPLTKLVSLYKENYNLTMEYNSLTQKKMDLIYQKNLIAEIPSDPSHINNIKRAKLQSEIEDIESRYKNSPIYRLIKEGEYSTISAVGTTYEEIDITKQKLSDWLESRTNKFAEGSKTRTAISEILMNKSSAGYQLAAEFVNLGDWLAKSVAYRYLTEGDNPRGLRLNHGEARNIASILFVDFDQFVSRERDYLNRIGLMWFTSFKYRMVPAALLGILLNPSRLILGTALSNWTGIGTPLSENIIAKFFGGELGYSLGYDMLWSGIGLHPIPTLYNMVK